MKEKFWPGFLKERAFFNEEIKYLKREGFMKILVDDDKLIELIRYILQNDYEVYNISEIEEMEKRVLDKFENEKVIEFIYQYISEIIKSLDETSVN